MTLTRLLLVLGLISGSKIITNQITMLADNVAGMAVQMETSQIAEMVYLDSIVDSIPNPEDFQSYLRLNMVQRIGYGDRDTSKDFWGNPYALKVTNNQILVQSAGPDGIFGTDDDIVSGIMASGLPAPAPAGTIPNIPIGPTQAPMDRFKSMKSGTSVLQASLSPSLASPRAAALSRQTITQKLHPVVRRSRTQVATYRAFRPDRGHGLVVARSNARPIYGNGARRTVATTTVGRPTGIRVNPRLEYNIRMAYLWIKYFESRFSMKQAQQPARQSSSTKQSNNPVATIPRARVT